MNTSFFEQMLNFAVVLLLWPLLFGLVLFYVLVFPAFLCIILALFLALKRQYPIAISLFLTILLLLSSLFKPITIKNQKDLSSVTMGLPVAFYVQDQSQFEPPLPWQTVLTSAHENPTNVLWPQFAESFILVFVPIFGILSTVSIFHHHRQNKKCSHQSDAIE